MTGSTLGRYVRVKPSGDGPGEAQRLYDMSAGRAGRNDAQDPAFQHARSRLFDRLERNGRIETAALVNAAMAIGFAGAWASPSELDRFFEALAHNDTVRARRGRPGPTPEGWLPETLLDAGAAGLRRDWLPFAPGDRWRAFTSARVPHTLYGRNLLDRAYPDIRINGTRDVATEIEVSTLAPLDGRRQAARRFR